MSTEIKRGTEEISTYISICCDVSWIGNDYWQWHKRGMEEVSYCLGVVAQCLVSGLLVTIIGQGLTLDGS